MKATGNPIIGARDVLDQCQPPLNFPLVGTRDVLEQVEQ